MLLSSHSGSSISIEYRRALGLISRRPHPTPDQAETTVSGFYRDLLVVRRWFLSPSSMGQWQVTIKDEKSGASMSTAVPVDAEGKFSVNLGRLTAGTRFIVAEARMVNDGAVITERGNLLKAVPW